MTEASDQNVDWETRLAEATRRGSNVTPGVVLAAVDKDGTLFYDKAAGFASLDPDAAPLTRDGIMWIASCTKLLTSICALQCVERGQITLDEPLGDRHLPELADPQVVTLDETAPGGFVLRPARGKITLRALLTHTSGLAYEWGDARLKAWREANPFSSEDEGLMSRLYNTPLLFDPGEGWVYGGGLDWAGILVARLNNTTLDDYFQQHIFAPLNLTSTTFHLAQRPDLLARLVRAAHRDASDGTLHPHQGMLYHTTVRDHSGGGGLWSCAADYIAILADLVRDTPTLLTRDSITQLLAAPQLAAHPLALAGLVASRGATAANAAPTAAAAAAAAAAATEAGLDHGLGGMVLTRASPFLPAGSLCWGGLPNLKWFVHPERQVAALCFAQVMPAGDAQSARLAGQFFQEVIRLHDERLQAK